MVIVPVRPSGNVMSMVEPGAIWNVWGKETEEELNRSGVPHRTACDVVMRGPEAARTR